VDQDNHGVLAVCRPESIAKPVIRVVGCEIGQEDLRRQESKGDHFRVDPVSACFAAELVLEQLVEVVVPPNEPSGGEAEVLGTGVEEGDEPARVLPLRRCIELSYESQEGDRIQGID
jgi:hypothetical protein